MMQLKVALLVELSGVKSQSFENPTDQNVMVKRHMSVFESCPGVVSVSRWKLGHRLQLV